MIFCLQTEQDEKPEKIIKEKICGISIYNRKDKNIKSIIQLTVQILQYGKVDRLATWNNCAEFSYE